MPKVRGVVARTDMTIIMQDGSEVFITHENLRESAKRNGWKIEPIPGKPGHLQAVAEMECRVPLFDTGEVSMGISLKKG